MKIVLLINTLLGGGAEKQLLLTATAVAGAGHSCVIITLRGHPPHDRIQRLLAAAQSSGVVWLDPQVKQQFVWQQLRRVWRYLRDNPDAVIWAWGHRANVVGYCGSLLYRRTRLVLSLRDADQSRIVRFRWWWRCLVARASLLLSNSHLNIEQLDQVAPGAHSKAEVVYNALTSVDLDHPPVRLPQPAASLRIVMLGNILIPKKGYDLVVPLARLIRERSLPWTIHIGGAPIQATELQAQIDGADLGNIVFQEGLVKDPLSFLSTGHVFLMLSRVEGLPNALIEAMSLGLPSICTRVGDVARIARDGKHLRLIDPGDVTGALSALEAMWYDWDSAVAMGARGRDLCRALFTEERMAAETLAVLARFEPEGGP